MKQLIVALPIAVLSVCGTYAQTTATNTEQVRTVRAGNKTTYGANQQAVAEYLMSKQIRPEEGDAYRRAAFKLTVDHTGKVSHAERFYGSVSEEMDARITRAFREMPAWKTSVATNEQSIVYVVVTLQHQTVTTEIY